MSRVNKYKSYNVEQVISTLLLRKNTVYIKIVPPSKVQKINRRNV